MFTIIKEIEISASHRLDLTYQSKCSNLHGHNWHVVVKCQSKELNENGMVYDFSHIKQIVMEQLDHQDISKKIIINGSIKNPTAENIAYWISKQIGDTCLEVKVEESDGNIAIWSK